MIGWSTELKNVLSGFFFLSSILFFLRWHDARESVAEDGSRKPAGRLDYGLYLCCAALALASKSSTVVLPVVLVLCVWWREGSLDRRNITGIAAAGRVDEAILQYRTATAINPEYVLAHNNLGNVLLSKRQIDEAIDQYERAVSIDPNFASAYNNFGNALLAKRQPDQAIVQYQKALIINPNYVEAHNNLGITFMRVARFAEAATQFEETLRLAPKLPGVPNELATAQALIRQAQSSR